MKKRNILLMILIISFVLFVLTGTIFMAVGKHQILKDVGLWSMFLGGSINVIVALLIYFDSKKADKKNNERKSNGSNDKK